MNRIFISHSSKQKNFTTSLANSIGQDRCIVDCYDFRSGEELEEEIKSKINQAGIFCLLISDSSLSSNWVTLEVQYVRNRVDDKTILFRAFIIDEKITPADPRISPWVRDFLLDIIPSYRIVSRVLSDNLRELDYKNYPVLKLQDSLFFGRGQELSNLETEQVIKSTVKAIVISGIPHVGRERFALQYLRKVTGDERLGFCKISMERGRSIEDLALYINDFVELFQKEILLETMVGEQFARKKDTVVQLLNKLYDYHQTLLIYDDFCIVQRNGHIIDWFHDVLRDGSLKIHAGIYIVSRVGVNFRDIKSLPMVQQALLPLENREINAIIKAYSTPQRLFIQDEDVKVITTSVKGFPGYVYPIVDAWVKYNRYAAFETMRDLEKSVSDVLEYIVDILNDSKSEARVQLLLLLSHFDLITIRQLRELYDSDNLEELLDGFQALSILEYFGYSREYVRIHPVVADFLRRSKRISLSKEFIEKISIRASEIVKEIETPECNEDIATYMYGIKRMLKNGLSSAKDVSRYMIPSLALNVIVEEYEGKNYDGVLLLCERMLNGSKNYDGHIEWNIHYWQCLALCRMKDSRLFKQVEYFKGSYTYHFLMGFYYRIQEIWDKAEVEYEKAMKLSGDNTDYNKIKQEIVLVRIKTGDYKGAVALAEENYKRQRFNSFFIEAYFRCLVKDPYSDTSLLIHLISDMDKSQDKNHREIAETMKAEYAYYFEGDFWKACKILQSTIEKNPSMQYPKEAFVMICKDADKPQVFRGFMKRFDAK